MFGIKMYFFRHSYIYNPIEETIVSSAEFFYLLKKKIKKYSICDLEIDREKKELSYTEIKYNILIEKKIFYVDAGKEQIKALEDLYELANSEKIKMKTEKKQRKQNLKIYGMLEKKCLNIILKS